MIGLRRLVLVVALFSLGACVKSKDKGGPDDALFEPSREGAGGNAGGGAKPEADPADDLPTPVARWSELTKQLGQDIRRVGTSCPQVAKVMRAFVSANGSEYGTLQKEMVKWEKRTLRKEVDRFYRRVFPDLSARIDAGIRCKDDDGARAAYDAFFRVAGLDLR